MSFKAGAIIGEAILDTKKWNTGVTSISNSFTSIARAGKAMGLAVAGYLTASTIAANAFQIEMANVSTVMDDTTDSTQYMTLALLKLDPRLGKTIELTESLYLAFSAGAESMEEAMTTTVDSAKFAAAALTTSTTALDILTTATNAYGKEVVSTTKASDIFFKTIEEGKVTGEQLSATIGQSIPLYASAGVGLEQLGAGIAALTKQGASASESTTQLNAIINAMLRPTKELSAAIKDYGYTSGGALLKAEGLTGVLKLMEKYTQGNIDKVSELTPNIRAMRGILALTGVGGEIYNDVLLKMAESAGATDRAFAKQERTFVTLRAELDKVAIVTGNITKYFIDELAVGATNAATAVLDFIMSSQGLEVVGDIAGYTAATFDLLSNVFLGLSNLLDKDRITAGLNSIKGAAEDVISPFSILSYVMQVVAGSINTVTAIIAHNVKITEAFVTSITTMAEGLKATFKVVTTFFKGGEEFTTAVSEMHRLNAIAREAGHTFDKLFLSGGKVLGDELAKTFSLVSDTGKQTATDLEVSFTTTFDTMKESVFANWLEIITGQKDFVEEVVEDIEEGTDEVVEVVEDGNEEVKKSHKTLLEQLSEAYTAHFKESKFTWSGFFENLYDLVDQGLSIIGDLSDLYYANQLTALEQSTKDQLDILDDSYTSRLKLLEGNTLAEYEAVEKGLIGINDLINSYRQADLDALGEKTEAELAYEKYKRDKYIESLENSLDEEDKLELAAFLAKEQREKELAETKKKVDAEKLALQTEYDTATALLAKKALDEQNKIAEEQFNLNKALSIAAVWMNVGTAIAGFWAAAAGLGPIAGPIFGGAMSLAMAGVGIAQTGLINEQKFIPAREMGGMASGLTRVNEAGGEIITLPDGSQVIPNDISQQIAQNTGSAGNVINVNFNDTVISSDYDIEYVAKQVSYYLGRELKYAV